MDDAVCTMIHVKEGDPIYLSAQSPRLIQTKEEVKMTDLSPPGHNGPSSHGRASRQSR